jgi:hypothetical protein
MLCQRRDGDRLCAARAALGALLARRPWPDSSPLPPPPPPSPRVAAHTPPPRGPTHCRCLSLSTSLWGGKVVVKDAHLKEDVLDLLGLPVTLREGTIGCLEVEVRRVCACSMLVVGAGACARTHTPGVRAGVPRAACKPVCLQAACKLCARRPRANCVPRVNCVGRVQTACPQAACKLHARRPRANCVPWSVLAPWAPGTMVQPHHLPHGGAAVERAAAV